MLPWPEIMTILGIHVAFAQSREGRESIHAGQPDVEQDDVVHAACDPLEAAFAAVDGVHLVAFIAEDPAKRGAYTRFVVDDEYPLHQPATLVTNMVGRR